MEIILCFASYEDKKGMYYNTKIDLFNFDKQELTEEIESYYKRINVEEFFLADIWTDDSEQINNIIVKRYTECYITMINFLEELQNDITDIDMLRFEIACDVNSNYRDIRYLVNYSENISIIEDIWDYFDEYINTEKSTLATNLFQMKNETEALESLRRLGFCISDYNDTLYEDLN